MIKINELTLNDIGRRVAYRGNGLCRPEVGRLTSWSRFLVFVRFHGPDDEACRPEDVSFEHDDFTPLPHPSPEPVG